MTRTHTFILNTYYLPDFEDDESAQINILKFFSAPIDNFQKSEYKIKPLTTLGLINSMKHINSQRDC